MDLYQEKSTIIPEDFRFEKDLQVGTKSIDVRYLHFLLGADPETRLPDAGNADYFSSETRKRVEIFQAKYVDRFFSADREDRDPPGLVGKKTRGGLNAFLAGGLPSPLELVKKA